MAKFSVQVGSTSQTINLFVQNSTSTSGAGLTALTATGVTGYYAFARQAPVAITLVTTTVATGVFATGAFIEISSANMPGWYRVDVPNASLASGNGNYVDMHFFGGTNMAPVPVEIELTVVNNQSSTFGLASTLPVNITSWAGAPTATTNISLATLVNVAQWAGFSTATTQSAIATTPSVNTIQWAGFTTATTQVAIATSPLAVNTTQWAGASTATTQSAIATTPAVNSIQWAGASTATNQVALATAVPLATAAYTGIWTYVADGTITAEQSLRIINASAGGKLTGASGTDVTIRNPDDSKNRITASGDIYGNRNTVSYNLT